MFDPLSFSLWGLYGLGCLVLLVYGLNNYVMVGLFLRRGFGPARTRRLRHARQREAAFAQQLRDNPGEAPLVLTQLPIYNEYNVAERVMRAAAAIDYPPARHHIQVLDDSTDETTAIVDAAAADLRKAGHWVEVVRRANRHGFKAGALREGMARSDAQYIAIFDSDFIPEPGFLKRTLPQLLANPAAALVQTRWGHINEHESWLTRAICLGVDGHFSIEQPARAWNGLCLNFNGTAGIWRRDAIVSAGGWQDDTLTEDMDLSYRAQLGGWRIVYLPDVVTPAEIPNTFTAFKSQQFRWAKGSIQTALKILPRLMRSRLSPFQKLQGAFHLTQYFIHAGLVSIAVLTLPVALLPLIEPPPWFWVLIGAPVIFAAVGPSLLFLVSQYVIRGRQWWRSLAILPSLIVVGFGSSICNTRAVIEALSGHNSPFVRTPKRGSATRKKYALPRSFLPWLEIFAGLYCLTALTAALSFGRGGMAVFLAVYVLGYLVVGSSSLAERLRA